MKTPEELHAHQSKMPALRSYFVVWERPHGSYTWTLLVSRSWERAEAEDAAQARVDDKTRPICDCIVTEAQLPRMPSPIGSEPLAVLPNETGPAKVYYGKGHAR